MPLRTLTARFPRPRRSAALLALSGLGSLAVISLGGAGQAERSERRLAHRAELKGLLEAGTPPADPAPSQRSQALAPSAAPYRITPERRALLNTIRFAEGTWSEGNDRGYRTLYGGQLFENLERHPEKVVVRRYASAAAGAYQFLPGTWSEAARKLSLESFRPEHQDQAALYLAEKRGALEEVDRRGLTTTAMARLAPEWASFPTPSGRSAYGQPVKNHGELARFYRTNLAELRRRHSPG